MLAQLKQPRTYVKFAVSCVHHMICVTATTAALNAVVDPETESAQETVDTVGFMAGSVIWWHTDDAVKGAVDKLADKRIARKEAKRAAKTPVAVVVPNESLHKLSQQ